MGTGATSAGKRRRSSTRSRAAAARAPAKPACPIRARGLHGRPTLVKTSRRSRTVPRIVALAAPSSRHGARPQDRPARRSLCLNALFRRPGTLRGGVRHSALRRARRGSSAAGSHGHRQGLLIGGPAGRRRPPRTWMRRVCLRGARRPRAAARPRRGRRVPEGRASVRGARCTTGSRSCADESCGRCAPCRLGAGAVEAMARVAPRGAEKIADAKLSRTSSPTCERRASADTAPARRVRADVLSRARLRAGGVSGEAWRNLTGAPRRVRCPARRSSRRLRRHGIDVPTPLLCGRAAAAGRLPHLPGRGRRQRRGRARPAQPLADGMVVTTHTPALEGERRTLLSPSRRTGSACADEAIDNAFLREIRALRSRRRSRRASATGAGGRRRTRTSASTCRAASTATAACASATKSRASSSGSVGNAASRRASCPTARRCARARASAAARASTRARRARSKTSRVSRRAPRPNGRGRSVLLRRRLRDERRHAGRPHRRRPARARCAGQQGPPVRRRAATRSTSSTPPDRVTAPDDPRRRRLARHVSWDEATRYVAERLARSSTRHGPDSIGVLGSARATNEENYVAQKFARVVLGTNNVDCCARVCHAPTAAALKTMLGTGAATNSFDDIELARTILVCGANPTEDHPIIGARIKQAARRGAKLIVIDPARDRAGEYADVHLALRPGTNVALLNAMAHVIVDGRARRRGVRRRTRSTGFDAFRAFIESLDARAGRRSTAASPRKRSARPRASTRRSRRR